MTDNDRAKLMFPSYTFAQISNDFIHHWMGRLGPTTSTVYIALVSFRNNQSRTCWVGLTRVATMAGVSLRTVQRAINTLTECGVIQVRSQYGEDGRQTTNEYFFPDSLPIPTDEGGHGCQGGDDTGDRGEDDTGDTPPVTRVSPKLYSYELDDSELDDSNYVYGGGGIPPCSSVNKPDTTATAEERHSWEDPDAGWLFDEVLPRAGVMVSSPYAAEAWLDLLELTRDHAFIEEAFQSAAEMGKVPNARYIQAILQRCLEEGRRPGAGKRPKQRDGDLPDGFGTNFKDVF
jgi:hypothetical protein